MRSWDEDNDDDILCWENHCYKPDKCANLAYEKALSNSYNDGNECEGLHRYNKCSLLACIKGMRMKKCKGSLIDENITNRAKDTRVYESELARQTLDATVASKCT